MKPAGLFILLSTLALAVSAQDRPTPSALFSTVSGSVVPAAGERSSIASRREAEVVFDAHVRAMPSVVDKLSIQLFDGKAYEAQRTDTEVRAIDDSTWRGKIGLGTFAGDVVLTFRKGYVAGLIYSPSGVYEIVPRGDKHFLVELDQSAFPECAGDVTGDVTTSEAPSAMIDSGDRIDVLILYTASVRSSLGGDSQAAAFAQQAIDATNTAYINSRIRQRVRLVGAKLTALTETGNFSTELTNLRSDAATAILRNSLKADLVDMLTNSTAACGIGYLMGPPGGNQNNAFTVTARTCAVGNLSFAHELGHNMGSHHNPENGGTATYPYSYGHWINGSYRTVMSYSDPCGNGCPRVPYFSNPSVLYNDVATGVENARDNARSINNTADWIANYRYSGSSIELAVLNSGELVPRMIRRDIEWKSDNVTGSVRIDFSRDGGTTWQAIVKSTANDGLENVAVPVRPTRRARLRIVSLNDPAVSDTSLVNFVIR